MSRLILGKSLAGGVLSGLFSLLMMVQGLAQKVPPDFSANQAGWIAFLNDFIAPASGPQPTTYDPRHPFVQNNSGKQPTYRIADISNPNLKPWARESMKKANDEVFAGKVALTARSSCRPASVPGFMLYVQNPVFFIHTPKQVRMIFSGDQQVRRVYLNVPHSTNPKPSWYGESVGTYEDDTLVVDTIAVDKRTFVDNYRTPHTESMHVTERWKLIDGGKLLEVNIRVDDPETLYEPWTAIQRYRECSSDIPSRPAPKATPATRFTIIMSRSPTSRIFDGILAAEELIDAHNQGRVRRIDCGWGPLRDTVRPTGFQSGRERSALRHCSFSNIVQ